MKKLNTPFLLLFLCLSGYAQNQELRCSNTPYFGFEAKNFKIQKYMPQFIAKKAYSNLKEVTNQYPEQLVESEMSVTSQEWSSFNYGKPREAEPQRYASIKKMDIDKNFSKLLLKIQYEVNGEEFAIIKFDIYSDKKNAPTVFVLAMKKVQNRWIIYDEAAITDLMFFMMFLKTETLEAIFNQQKTGNSKMDEIIESSKINNTFSLNQCLFLTKSVLEKDKSSLESILDPNRMFK
jgi:hypothetical protein